MSKGFADPKRRDPRRKFEDRLADEARFIKTWIDKPILTGAVSPSGRFLARAMAQAVNPNGEGPIVELGPGTGPITQALLARGVDPARLLLVEYDGAFCQLLRRRFPQVTVIQADAYALRASLAGVLRRPAATVVSSLPLLNKPDSQRLALLEDAFAIMGDDGSFVQFTYGMNSPVPRAALREFDTEVSPPIWLNLPPARVWIYRRRDVAAERVFDLKSRAATLRESRGMGSGSFRPAALGATEPRFSLFRRDARAHVTTLSD